MTLKVVYNKEELSSRYFWLHRLHIVLVAYMLLLTVGKFKSDPQLLELYPIFLVVYLVFPKIVDFFTLNLVFYFVTLWYALAMLLAVKPGRRHIPEVIYAFYGYSGVFILLIIFVNSILVVNKLFGITLADIVAEMSPERKGQT